MSGLDIFGCEEEINDNAMIGFDYMALLKGGGGLLSGLSGGDQKGQQPSAQQLIQQQQLQQAQQSASTMKMILIGLSALLILGGMGLALTRR